MNRLAKHNDGKAVIFENGAFILYQMGDVGYGLLDWCYTGIITYDPKDDTAEKEAEKKAGEFLGVPMWG